MNVPVADLAALESQAFLRERLSDDLLDPALDDAIYVALSAPGNALSGTSLWARIAAAAHKDAGGVNFPLPSLYAGIELVMTAANVLDDVEDNDESPLIASYGPAVAVNIGSWLLVTGLALVGEADELMFPETGGQRSLLDRCTTMLRTAATGQHLDLISGEPDLDLGIRITGLKSGALVRGVCELGAAAAGADQAMVDSLGEIGFDLGMSQQFANDLKDVRPTQPADEIAARTGGVDQFARTLTLLTLVHLHADAALRAASQTGASFLVALMESLRDGAKRSRSTRVA